ncbi:hypothetical protein FRC01_003273 [Tulasnella sp. 417]|nr:hypothetical protein FRC01_003273 [Tulasnella sp. 417]
MALNKLKLLEQELNRLPASLPSPPIQQSSYQWHPDSGFLNDEGIVAATNQMLERVMDMKASGLTIRERGKGVLGVIEVLSLGEDVVDIGSSVVRNLLSSKLVIVRIELDLCR